MRLRHFHVRRSPPLHDVAISFNGDPSLAMIEDAGAVPNGAIHFIVGQNGSGKSHLLRALSATFLALSDQRLPPFPVTMMYELGSAEEGEARTVVFDNPGWRSDATLWVAKAWRAPPDHDIAAMEDMVSTLRKSDGRVATHRGADFRAVIAKGEFPQAAPEALPGSILAYTSGIATPWEEVWNAGTVSGDAEALETEYDASRERPPGWTGQDEMRALRASEPSDDSSRSTVEEIAPRAGSWNDRGRPRLVGPAELECALLTVMLQRTVDPDRVRAEVDPFTRARWGTLVGVRLGLDLERAASAPRSLLTILHDLLLVAGDCIADVPPLQKRRSLFFDVGGAVVPRGAPLMPIEADTQEERLHALLGGPDDTMMNRFEALLAWRRYGIVDAIELFCVREGLDDAEPTVLGLSDLSDGERLLLGRWALFSLISGEPDALLLLDEPETHFNDAWKREIVNAIAEAVRGTPSQVLVATHSSIVLSDVFDEEVILLRSGPQGPTASRVVNRTFGTDPSALMMTVFDAEDSIGERARAMLDGLLEDTADEPPDSRQIERMERIVERLGTGFHRTELLTRLNLWRRSEDVRRVELLMREVESDEIREKLRAIAVEGYGMHRGD